MPAVGYASSPRHGRGDEQSAGAEVYLRNNYDFLEASQVPELGAEEPAGFL